MQKNYSGPKALTEYILYQSKHKADKKTIILLIQGMLAGMYISLGAVGYFKVTTAVGDPGLGAFFGALVFPMGIIAILLMQAELFTSDSMVMIAVYDRRTKFNRILGILLMILFANLVGAVFAALMVKGAGIFSPETLDVIIHKAIHKVEMGTGQMLISAILCNIIVSTGVCLAYSCKDEIAEIIVVWLAITVFVLSGTEHVVANMFYCSSLISRWDLTIWQIFYSLAL